MLMLLVNNYELLDLLGSIIINVDILITNHISIPGVSAHCPILLNHSCYPMKSSPLKKKERKEGRKEEKGSQNLKEKNPTSCEEILGLMSFLHLPQVFSPG